MVYCLKSTDSQADQSGKELEKSLEQVIEGLDLKLLDFLVFHRKKSVQIKVTVYKGLEPVSVEDCSKAHRAIIPRLELEFSGIDLDVEVASPGIDRIIKEGREFSWFTGRYLKIYRIDTSDWIKGKLISSGLDDVTLETEDGQIRLEYSLIGKARLSN